MPKGNWLFFCYVLKHGRSLIGGLAGRRTMQRKKNVMRLVRVVAFTASVFSLLCGFPLWAATADPHVPVLARHGMVATGQHLATEIGVGILKEGGNAVDAAIAVGYAQAVANPCCGNIGGGGFMLIHLAHGRDHRPQDTFINFREKAPLRATRDMYLDKSGDVVPHLSTQTYLAVGIPGSVAGLEYAREHYGTMSRQALIAPALALARNGFVLKAGDVGLIQAAQQDLARNPEGARIFLRDGAPPAVGTIFVQPELATSLELISRQGADAFYKGPIAQAIVRDSAARGGILSMEDFARYSVEEERPVRCAYRGYEVISSPPPSSGGTTICEILNILAGYDLSHRGFHSPDSLHVTIEAERRAYADRNAYLGDPDFVKNPLERLLSPEYAARLRGTIGDAATPSKDVKPGLGDIHEGTSTTHYSIVDRDGNAVAVTYTINSYFGTGIVAPGTGVLLNNEMDDFTAKPGVPNQFGLVQGEANSVAPQKRPLSSMAPTIVTHDGKFFMVAGSPGGSRIITITLGVLQNVIDYGMNIQEAIDAPRVHHQWLPDAVFLEPSALSPQTRSKLEAEGYTLKDQSVWGAADAVLIDGASGTLQGGNDTRRGEGSASGY